MIETIRFIALYLGAVIFMEGFAWTMHRYVMHGWGWVWHRSHHEPRTGHFELNDLFAVVFAAPAIVAIYYGVHGIPWLLPVGCGITTYGAIYFLFHDGLVHRRFPMPKARSAYWKRLIQAHRFHHAVHTKPWLRLLRLPAGAGRPQAEGQAGRAGAFTPTRAGPDLMGSNRAAPDFSWSRVWSDDRFPLIGTRSKPLTGKAQLPIPPRGSDGRAVAARKRRGKSGLHGDKAAGNARRGRPQG